MRLRHVVTCFLQRATDGNVLVGRRSGDVSTYQARWAGISGSLEEDTPLQQAYREIEEETGLSPQQVELRATGRPIRFPDWQLGTVWVVHPYLFLCKTPAEVRQDWEHVEFQWIRPEDISELETVPKLHEAYLSVDRAFSSGGTHGSEDIFRMVAEDRTHGAAELGLWTLMGIRAALSEAAENCGSSGEALNFLTRKCRNAAGLRPSMAPPLSAALEAHQIIHSVFSQGRENLSQEVERADEGLEELIRTREQAPLEAARAATNYIRQGDHVVTLSYSFTVLATLEEAAETIGKLIVSESRPACEGRHTARAAASLGIETELMTDAAAAATCAESDVLLLGADSISADGRVVNKTGSLAMSWMAYCYGVGMVTVTTTDKFLPEGCEVSMEEMSPEELGEPIEGVTVRNPYFEAVPVDMIEELVTEKGTTREYHRHRLHHRLESVYNNMF